MNGGGQPHRLVQARLRIPQSALTALTVLGLDMDDEGVAYQFILGQTYPSAGSSCSWIGPIGITVEMACL